MKVPLDSLLIRPARPDEAPAITALAVRSKAHWGYNEAQMVVFAAELELVAPDVESKAVHVADVRGDLAGFFSLVPISPATMELEHLFIEPGSLRRGLGSVLLRFAMNFAEAGGYTALKIVSDSHALGFYEHFGAREVGQHSSSIPGRNTPVLELSLGENGSADLTR